MLKKIILAYKIISLELLENIKGGGTGEQLLRERKVLLDQIRDGKFKEEDVKRLVKDYEIIQLDKEIEKVYIENKLLIKQKIDNLVQTKEANRSYVCVDNQPLFDSKG